MVTIENDCFSISQICESGQCFRLDPVSENIYELIAADRYLEIEIQREEDGREKTVFSCTQEEYGRFWKTYFDLDASYSDYIKQIDGKDDYLRAAAEFGRGIRILRQDIWEMILTFILSQQNNIPRIKKLIRVLSEKYGEERKTPEGKKYFASPTARSLAAASEEELRSLKLGYRSRYICKTAKQVAEEEINLTELSEMSYKDAREELMKLSGVGGKVADCICLFALHQMDAFPVDTHIRQVLDAHYADGFPFDRYKGCAGVMQQYIFYYDLKGGGEK